MILALMASSTKKKKIFLRPSEAGGECVGINSDIYLLHVLAYSGRGGRKLSISYLFQGIKIRKQRSTGDLDRKGVIGSFRSTGSTSSWMSSESNYAGVSVMSEGSQASFVVEVRLCDDVCKMSDSHGDFSSIDKIFQSNSIDFFLSVMKIIPNLRVFTSVSPSWVAPHDNISDIRTRCWTLT